MLKQFNFFDAYLIFLMHLKLFFLRPIPLGTSGLGLRGLGTLGLGLRGLGTLGSGFRGFRHFVFRA